MIHLDLKRERRRVLVRRDVGDAARNFGSGIKEGRYDFGFACLWLGGDLSIGFEGF